MSRAEYDAMAATGRVQPRLSTGQDAAHVTRPPDPNAYRAAPVGSMFVEFDVDDVQMTAGGTAGWAIIYGPNSLYGIMAARRGKPLAAMPAATNLVINTVKQGRTP